MKISYICKFCKENLGEDKNLAIIHLILKHKNLPKVQNISKEIDNLIKITHDIMEK